MNLLITGAWQQAQEHSEQIRAFGHTVLYLQQEQDPLPCDPDWAEGIICNSLFQYHPIESFPNLRWIQLTSAGLDRVPLDVIRQKGIEIHNAKGVYSIPMAEFAVAGVLALYKDLNRFRDCQQQRRWIKDRGLRELSGRTVLILGCGSVGTECARRFSAFGCRVIGMDPDMPQHEAFEVIVGPDRLDEMLAAADVTILSLPLTEETRCLIDERRLNLIRGILVNLSRGGIVDQKALEAWDGEAVLDVFEQEPLPESSPLWNQEKMLIFPHNSFVGEGNGRRLADLILKNLKEANHQ